MDLLDFSACRNPPIVPLQGPFANRVELVQKRRHKAPRTNDRVLRSGILGGNLEHECSSEDGEELVFAVDCQESS